MTTPVARAYNEQMRAVVGVLGVSLCGCLAAGCGSSLQALAHKQAKYFGDPHATVTRIERVQIENGTQWTMIQMKGRSPFQTGCTGGPPGGSQSCQARYLVLGVKLNSHNADLYWGLSSSQVAAITRARQARQLFRIFPDFAGLTIRCTIPRGGPAHSTVRGTCSTDARPPDHVSRVDFVERWPRSRRSGIWDTARWVVTLSRGRVKSIRVTGQPPQLWR